MNYLIAYETKIVNKVKISEFEIADFNDYDCYICAGYTEDNNFTNLINNIYNIKDSFVFDKNSQYKNEISNNIYFYNLDIDTVRTQNTANLSYFYNTYNDIFLKMNINGNEFKWLNTIDMYYLLKFKQILINFYPENIDISVQQICFDKLNYTHYIVSIIENKNTKIIVFLRKDIYDNYIENQLVGITIDKVADLK